MEATFTDPGSLEYILCGELPEAGTSDNQGPWVLLILECHPSSLFSRLIFLCSECLPKSGDGAARKHEHPEAHSEYGSER